MAFEEHNSVAMEREFGVSLPPISQVDCLGLHRVDVDALTKEHDDNMARLRNRHRRIVARRPVNEREFDCGRRKKRNADFPDGTIPPLSQIVMGSQHEVPWQQPGQPKPPRRNINNTRLLPISQVSCLLNGPDGLPVVKKDKLAVRSKYKIHDTDSSYIKLAKSGGQANLLHYIEAKPPLKRTLDNTYYPGTNSHLPEVKSKSVQEPTWKPSQWAALSPIKKADHHDELKDKK
jgi:hypothetical protein